MARRQRVRRRRPPPTLAAASVIAGVDAAPASAPPARADPEVGVGPLLAKLLPELSAALTAIIVLVAPTLLPRLDAEALALVLATDLALVGAGVMLVDVASRLQRPPPLWLGIVVATGVVGMTGLPGILPGLWQQGWWVLLPFVWSLLERIRELWTLPLATPLEKVRRRTLCFDRLYTALLLGVLYVVALLVNDVVHDGNVALHTYPWLLPIAVLGYFGVAAVNAWRVNRRAYTRRPGSLWPWIDRGQAVDLSPI